jgi:hypothetical protein
MLFSYECGLFGPLHDVITGNLDYATIRFHRRAPDGSYRLIEATLGKLCGVAPASVVLSLRLMTKLPS